MADAKGGGPRRMTVMRRVVVAGVAGMLLGMAARAAMRFVALESGGGAGFSFGGSLEVVVFGALIGTPIALLFFALRDRTRRGRPWLGILVGITLFIVLSLLPPPAARSALADTPDTPSATAVAFAVVFVCWGWMLEYLANGVTARAPRSRSLR